MDILIIGLPSFVAVLCPALSDMERFCKFGGESDEIINHCMMSVSQHKIIQINSDQSTWGYGEVPVLLQCQLWGGASATTVPADKGPGVVWHSTHPIQHTLHTQHTPHTTHTAYTTNGTKWKIHIRTNDKLYMTHYTYILKQ